MSRIRVGSRSSPYYQNTALYPIIDLIHRILRWHTDETPDAEVEKLEQHLRQFRCPGDASVPLFASLLSVSIPEKRYPPLTLSPQRQRQRRSKAWWQCSWNWRNEQPVLFILEDLHWTDPTTLEFLGLLVEQVPTSALYTVLTCRPHFQPAWHHRSYLTEVTVNHLSRHQIERVAAT